MKRKRRQVTSKNDKILLVDLVESDEEKQPCDNAEELSGEVCGGQFIGFDGSYESHGDDEDITTDVEVLGQAEGSSKPLGNEDRYRNANTDENSNLHNLSLGEESAQNSSKEDEVSSDEIEFVCEITPRPQTRQNQQGTRQPKRKWSKNPKENSQDSKNNRRSGKRQNGGRGDRGVTVDGHLTRSGRVQKRTLQFVAGQTVKRPNTAGQSQPKRSRKSAALFRPCDKNDASHCQLCGQSLTQDVLESGKLYSNGVTTLHYFCVLFADNIIQQSDAQIGLFGFKATCLEKLVEKGKRNVCHICKNKGASVACSVKHCTKMFHFPCGYINNHLFIFSDLFKATCNTHKSQLGCLYAGSCSICWDEISAVEKGMTVSCCKQSFHRVCIQRMALASGLHHINCPLCQNKRKFKANCLNAGIYIPDQDAEWEKDEEYAQHFREQSSPVQSCVAEHCGHLKPSRLKRNGTPKFAASDRNLVKCVLCGSNPVHAACGGLKKDQEYTCSSCQPNNSKATVDQAEQIIDLDEPSTSGTASSLANYTENSADYSSDSDASGLIDRQRQYRSSVSSPDVSQQPELEPDDDPCASSSAAGSSTSTLCTLLFTLVDETNSDYESVDLAEESEDKKKANILTKSDNRGHEDNVDTELEEKTAKNMDERNQTEASESKEAYEKEVSEDKKTENLTLETKALSGNPTKDADNLTEETEDETDISNKESDYRTINETENKTDNLINKSDAMKDEQNETDPSDSIQTAQTSNTVNKMSRHLILYSVWESSEPAKLTSDHTDPMVAEVEQERG